MSVTIIRPGTYLYHVGSPGVRISSPGGAAAIPWWLSGGIPAANAICAYTPKGAASLAASYDNNAAPGNGLPDGTYDAAPGVAPTFDVATGWTFNGSTQYLTTGVIPATAAWSGFIQFSGARTVLGADRGNTLFGAVKVAGGVRRFYLCNARTSGALDVGVEYGIGKGATEGTGWDNVLPSLAAGNLGAAGAFGFRNGVSDGFVTQPDGTSLGAFIGGLSLDGTPLAGFYFLGNILAAAFYDVTITAPQITALVAAMSLL